MGPPTGGTDLDSFLDAIEADPADALRWLVFADWLEERGEPLSDLIRETVRDGRWEDFCNGLHARIGRRQGHRVACECLLRVLPLYEARYPEDQTPRTFLEVSMRYEAGKRVDAAREAIRPSCRSATEDFLRDPEGVDLPLSVIANVQSRFRRASSSVRANCATIAARAAFGPDFAHSKSFDTPRWRSLLAAEYRWQATRLLRRRLASPGGGSTGPTP